MRVVAIIQARMTSTRLPGKVLSDIGGMPLLERMIRRVRGASRLDALWVATTKNSMDDPVAGLCKRLDVPVSRGDEHDVLSRYQQAAAEAQADVIVRLTADCPLADPKLVDQAVGLFLEGGYDYFSNAVKRTYPDGLDVEVFSRATLERASREATRPYDREHVTPYMQGADFKTGHLRHDVDLSRVRWTVDVQADLEVIRRLFVGLPEGFSWKDALALAERNPELMGQLPAGASHGNGMLTLRPATASDAKMLFNWVNSPDSLAVSLKTNTPILWEQHLSWLQERLSDPNSVLLMAELEGKPVGQVRFQDSGEGPEVSIYIAAEFRQQGLAQDMLRQAIPLARERWHRVPLLARIKADNAASRNLFLGSGFRVAREAQDHQVLTYEQVAQP